MILRKPDYSGPQILGPHHNLVGLILRIVKGIWTRPPVSKKRRQHRDTMQRGQSVAGRERRKAAKKEKRKTGCAWMALHSYTLPVYGDYRETCASLSCLCHSV